MPGLGALRAVAVVCWLSQFGLEAMKLVYVPDTLNQIFILASKFKVLQLTLEGKKHFAASFTVACACFPTQVLSFLRTSLSRLKTNAML